MNARWSYEIVDIKPRIFTGSLTERLQAELDRMGVAGWELVSVVQSEAMDSVRLFFKKAA